MKWEQDLRAEFDIALNDLLAMEDSGAASASISVVDDSEHPSSDDYSTMASGVEGSEQDICPGGVANLRETFAHSSKETDAAAGASGAEAQSEPVRFDFFDNSVDQNVQTDMFCIDSAELGVQIFRTLHGLLDVSCAHRVLGGEVGWTGEV